MRSFKFQAAPNTLGAAGGHSQAAWKVRIRLFDLGTRNLKTGQSALLRFLWSSVENVWIQFLGAGLQMALELPQVRRDATGSG